MQFGEKNYTGAVELYRQALEQWDHPAVHGNLAVALIHLEQPLAAIEHLETALRWDSAPLDAHVYQQLITSQKLLQTQLARITVGCEAEGAAVTLDGNELFTCPGKQTRYAMAGMHQLVARKPSYLTFTRRFDAARVESRRSTCR